MPNTVEQQKAIDHLNGPCLVLAGAGTGKTKVITERIANLIANHQIRGDAILALTFTEKAASEMQERLDLLLPLGENTVFTGTFHAFAADLISRYPYQLGINGNRRIVTATEAVSIVRQQFSKLHFQLLQPPDNPVTFLRQYLAWCDATTESLADTGALLLQAKTELQNTTEEAERERILIRIELLENLGPTRGILADANVMTYADIMAYAVSLLQSSPLALKEERNRWRYILVDEYQDTNPAQATLVSVLAGENGNLFVVGDDDQAIYGFRGADMRNITGFTERYHEASVITLTDNFRSTTPILEAAYALITHNNPDRLEVALGVNKKLVSHRSENEPVRLFACDTDSNEASVIADEISLLITSGTEPCEIAVLSRSHNALTAIEIALEDRGVPLLHSKPQSFYQLPAVAQALAFLTFTATPQNSHNLFYLLTGAPFHILPAALNDALVTSRRLRSSLWQVLTNNAPEGCSDAVAWLTGALETCNPKTPSVSLVYFVKRSGFETGLLETDAVNELRSLNQLYQELRSFEKTLQRATVDQYLEMVGSLIEAGEDAVVTLEDASDLNAVRLLTVHGSKGLEFSHVYIVGLTEQSFPPYPRSSVFAESSLTDEDKQLHYQEERRLFYVAMTRAKERLTLSYPIRKRGAKTNTRPSRFISEALPGVAAHTPSKNSMPRIITPQVAPQPAIEMPLIHSISSIETFAYDRTRYQQQYIYQLIDEESADANFGTVLHDVLRAAVAARMHGEAFDIDAYYYSVWNPYDYESEERQLHWKTEGLACIKRYLDTDTATPVHLEYPVRLALGKYTVTGKVDRINSLATGGMSIIDYKTRRARGQITDQLVKKNLPLAFYALALQGSGSDIRELGLDFIVLKEKVRTEVSPKLLESTEIALQTHLEALEACYTTGDFSNSFQ